MNKLLYIFFLAFLFVLQISATSDEAVGENIKVLNAEELKNLVENNEIVVVGFLENVDAKEKAYISGIANTMKEERLNFVITIDNESTVWASEKMNVQIEKPALILFRQGNGYQIPFDKIYSKPMYNIRELCLKALKPYVDELNSQINTFNFDHILYFYADEEDKIAKLELMQQLSIKYFQEFEVQYINVEKNPLNLNSPDLKYKFIIVSNTIQSYVTQNQVLSEEDATTFENISYFVDYYKSGEIDPEFLWRNEEMNWDFTDYVTEVRPNIYDNVVLNPKNDVIMLYYKADCPYSQQVMKSFQDLAKRYINQRHKLTVGQFEAENQNIPKSSPWRNLVEYPTIVLYPATKNGKKRQFYVMKQNLGRSAINIASWLLKRATNSYDEVVYSQSDYQKLNEIDGGIIVQDPKEEMEEIKINKLLNDPNLIYTVYGQGLDQKFYTVENEEDVYYIGNTDYKELPMTATYYELTPHTYILHRPEPTTNPTKELVRQNIIKQRKNEL